MNQSNILDEMNKDLSHLTSTAIGRRAFLMSLPVLLAGCASTEKTRYREGDNTGQKASLTVRDEEKMTREYLPKMNKDYPKLRSSYAQSYIKNLGDKIIASNNLNGKPYKYNFRVVDSKQVNAFALPAGEVFVTKGLIQMADNEAELAGVVGHEIGHIKARHTAERLYQTKKDQTKSILYGIGGALLGGAAGYTLAKKLCSKQDRDCIARLTQYGALAGGAGGLLIQKYAFMANSREDEMEADRIGFITSVNAGFDSNHVGDFYSKLLIMEQKYSRNKNSINKAFVDAMSTHPPSKARVSQMNQMSNKHRSKGVISGRSFKKLKRLI
jgi:predicted Zn-dependent protease